MNTTANSRVIKIFAVLAGVAQWTECWSANQRVTGSVPSQETCLGCRPGSPLEGTREATTP